MTRQHSVGTSYRLYEYPGVNEYTKNRNHVNKNRLFSVSFLSLTAVFVSLQQPFFPLRQHACVLLAGGDVYRLPCYHAFG